jgi:hypothetical protein
MALPNLIIFLVISRLGAGLSAVVYTLPPLLTVALAALLGIERPGGRRLAGIGLGFVSAALYSCRREACRTPIFPAGCCWRWRFRCRRRRATFTARCAGQRRQRRSHCQLERC